MFVKKKNISNPAAIGAVAMQKRKAREMLVNKKNVALLIINTRIKQSAKSQRNQRYLRELPNL